MLSPSQRPCTHVPTDAERKRDPIYLGCMADVNEPCFWASRQDGVADPEFHSERTEAASSGDGSAPQVSTQQFDQAVLATGVV